MSSFSPPSTFSPDRPWLGGLPGAQVTLSWPLRVKVLMVAVALVVVPVFFEAPLVRSLPWLGLTLTGTWLLAGVALMTRNGTHPWGDLLVGFAWTWLAGSLYWGWFRWEPFVHIPVESIAIPMVVILLSRGLNRIGCYFYLGSLLGTAVTDLYMYCMDLIPIWRQVMVSDPNHISPLMAQAVGILHSPGALGLALVMGLGLLLVGLVPLRSQQPCWWAFSGAVLSTLIVDGLFALGAILA